MRVLNDGRARTIAIVLSALLGSSAVLVSQVPQAALAVTCSVTTPVSAPARISGPAVKATGRTQCTTSVYNLQTRVRIYAKDCGACSWYQVASTGFVNCYGCQFNTRSAQTFCSGTKQYFSHVDGYFTTDGIGYLEIPGSSSTATWIAC